MAIFRQTFLIMFVFFTGMAFGQLKPIQANALLNAPMPLTSGVEDTTDRQFRYTADIARTVYDGKVITRYHLEMVELVANRPMPAPPKDRHHELMTGAELPQIDGKDDSSTRIIRGQTLLMFGPANYPLPEDATKVSVYARRAINRPVTPAKQPVDNKKVKSTTVPASRTTIDATARPSRPIAVRPTANPANRKMTQPPKKSPTDSARTSSTKAKASPKSSAPTSSPATVKVKKPADSAEKQRMQVRKAPASDDQTIQSYSIPANSNSQTINDSGNWRDIFSFNLCWLIPIAGIAIMLILIRNNTNRPGDRQSAVGAPPPGRESSIMDYLPLRVRQMMYRARRNYDAWLEDLMCDPQTVRGVETEELASERRAWMWINGGAIGMILGMLTSVILSIQAGKIPWLDQGLNIPIFTLLAVILVVMFAYNITRLRPRRRGGAAILLYATSIGYAIGAALTSIYTFQQG